MSRVWVTPLLCARPHKLSVFGPAERPAQARPKLTVSFVHVVQLNGFFCRYQHNTQENMTFFLSVTQEPPEKIIYPVGFIFSLSVPSPRQNLRNFSVGWS